MMSILLIFFFDVVKSKKIVDQVHVDDLFFQLDISEDYFIESLSDKCLLV